MALPTRIHTTAQVRALDRLAIESGTAGYTLMTRAAGAALDVLRRQWPAVQRVLVVCGGGNNGGDGYVLARLAREQGLDATVATLVAPERLRGDAQQAWSDCRAAAVPINAFSAEDLKQSEMIVDAIFGTGLDRAVDGVFAPAIDSINASGLPVLALDVPSGLHSDSGRVMGTAVRASATVSFVGLKVGCFTGQGLTHCGRLHFASLDLPERNEAPVLERLDHALLAQLLPRRARDAHKGSFGHVLIVGGGQGMAGAVRLCGEAALRAGAGLVSIATRSQNAPAIAAGRPELMAHAADDAAALAPLIERATVIVAGPGLGRDAWAQSLLDTVLASDRPLVLDADALNLLASVSGRHGNWILTPHPAEAGRLLGIETAAVQDDRIGTLRALVERFGGVIVLKGAGTLIGALAHTPAVCTDGNPGMATAGTGDVLTGVVAGLLAQLRNPWNAARAGVLAHAMAGDRAAARGERGTIASDLFEHVRACLNPPAS